MIDVKPLRRTSAALGVLTAAAMAVQPVNASDHQEAPTASAFLSADIGDYYAWHEGDELNLILTFGTFSAPGLPASFDRDVLYGFHFDTSIPADGIADIEIFARFAQDSVGDWGLQVAGIGDTPLEGPVETVLANSELTAWAGLADDPFFFDQSGFNTTVSSGVLSFDPTRDDVAGLNVTAIAIQLPITTIQSEGSQLQTWATTSNI